MPLADQDKIRALLEPYHRPVVSAIHGAWQSYRNLLAVNPIAYPRTRANVVWDWAIQDLKERIGAIAVRIHATSQTTWFYVNQNTLFRIKKCDEDGYTQNYPTQAALDFYDPGIQLPGIESAIRLDIGYILDQTETAIQDIRVVYRNGPRVEWQYSVLDVITDVTEIPRQSKVGRESRVKVKDQSVQSAKSADKS